MPLILNKISKIPLLHFDILTVKGGVFLGFWPISVRINGINRRLRPKKSESGRLGGQNLSIGSLGGHPENRW
jgi:hypothetical protein